MKLRRRQAHKDPHINLVPLIDTLFLLLVFFMMTTTFNQKGMIDIILPHGEANSSEHKSTENQPIRVIINAKGEYAINDAQHTLINNDAETLKRALQKEAGNNPNPVVIISGDAKAPYEEMLRAVQMVGTLNYVVSLEYEQKVTDSK
ncbi:MAG: biopolymer transporter ExbD [Thiotrichaceae bacterium]|nr:biopolymer transporter ExbD [Thiotrichaceae bacterium]